mmetsp:Transcript_13111/g.37200  ORF Transcript_13111/g.37200 Transcript_13111/m.37200 type:complete len:205 (-) Transcript_13111:1377-1991(-)
MAHTLASTSPAAYLKASSVRGAPILCSADVCSASILREAAPPFLLALRLSSLASSMAFPKPALSTERPRSSAMSSVRSTGKPKVSHRRKASGPVICRPRAALAILSKRSRPFLRVLEKEASSSAMISMMRSRLALSSGNTAPIFSTTTGTSWAKKPSLAPSFSRPYRTPRRSTRLSTYSRPSLPGCAPSAMATDRVRMWSATTR